MTLPKPNYFRISVLSFLLLLSGFLVEAQEDTTNVQLIEFSDGLDNRRSWRVFPPSDNGKTYRKVLMYHKLKCDPSLINNPTNSGCGEWDAGANFTYYDHSHSDSLRYRYELSYPDSLAVTTNQSYSIYQSKQHFIVYDVVGSESSHAVGSGGIGIDHALQSSLHSGRAQYLYHANELTTVGMIAGAIDKLGFDFSSVGPELKALTIRMRHSNLDSLTAETYETENLQTVYEINTTISNTGAHTFNLTWPFSWDGISNIVIDISFTNTQSGADHSMVGHSTAFSSGVFNVSDDQYMEFDSDYIDIKMDNLAPLLDSQVTVAFWTYIADSSMLNETHVTFGGVDANNTWKILNRMPAGNGRFFWYSGNTGGLDNINTPDPINKEILLGWNHWTFTKDAVTSKMEVFRNGEIFLEGSTGNERFMDNIAVFRLGNSRAFEQNYFHGGMNEFQIWNTVLDSNEIRNWMYKDIAPSHPNFANLVAYYKFDGGSFNAAFDETGNSNGQLFGMPLRKFISGPAQMRNMVAVSERPDITFTQGTYTTHLDSTLVLDSVANPSVSVVVSQSVLDFNQTGMQDIEIDTLYVWPANVYSYTYDPQGNIVDSVFVAENEVYRNYYTGASRRVAKYITAYGNFLDLGEGFTWIYDMTDLQGLLRDTIDFQGGDGRELIDLSFKFIEGIPPRTVNQLQMLEFGGSYENFITRPDDFIQNIYPESNSTAFAINTAFTGHSFNNPPNCSEFCRRSHFFMVDENPVYDWYLWKECSNNPLYPQGGTWIYDRTGWCPGAPVDQETFDITDKVTPGVMAQLRKGVEADPTGTQYGNWNGYVHIFSYGDPNFTTDAEVYDIIAPSDHDEYLRFNPICANPVIVIRNSGENTMTQAKIEYGIDGVYTRTFHWNGNLDFLEIDTVVLPTYSDFLWNGISGKAKFVARILEVNGAADEHAANDAFYTSFSPVASYDSTFIVLLRTNSVPEETSWDIRDLFGNVLYARNNPEANTFYWDTVNLPNGCYLFNMYDEGDDGLDFWNNNDGTGSIRFRAFSGLNFNTFDPDFGDHIRHQFTIGELNNVGIEELAERATINVFPNPSNGNFSVVHSGFKGEKLHLRVYDARGVLVKREVWSNVPGGDPTMKNVRIAEFSNGIYQLVLTDGIISEKRLITSSR